MLNCHSAGCRVWALDLRTIYLVQCLIFFNYNIWHPNKDDVNQIPRDVSKLAAMDPCVSNIYQGLKLQPVSSATKKSALVTKVFNQWATCFFPRRFHSIKEIIDLKKNFFRWGTVVCWDHEDSVPWRGHTLLHVMHQIITIKSTVAVICLYGWSIHLSKFDNQTLRSGDFIFGFRWQLEP